MKEVKEEGSDEGEFSASEGPHDEENIQMKQEIWGE